MSKDLEFLKSTQKLTSSSEIHPILAPKSFFNSYKQESSFYGGCRHAQPQCSSWRSICWLKGFTPKLLLCFYTAQTQSMSEGCCGGDAQRGQQQEDGDGSKQLAIKNQRDFGAEDPCAILRPANITQSICVVLLLPQLYWVWPSLHTRITLFGQIADSLHFSSLVSDPTIFLCLKACHFSPIYEEICLKVRAQSYCSALSIVENLQPSVNWKADEWTDSHTQKKPPQLKDE